jgi:Cu/Zn superoxide dismutase
MEWNFQTLVDTLCSKCWDYKWKIRAHNFHVLLTKMEIEQIAAVFVGIAAYFGVLYCTKKKVQFEPSILTCVLAPFGHVTFSQVENNLCCIECHLKDLVSGLHGLHAHEYGDLTKGCDSTCKHFNPENKEHGGPMGTNRHRGDFGNILVDKNGICEQKYMTNVNLHEIVGRGLVLHEDEDDLGLAQNDESKKTGNAGKRIACGVIGISQNMCHPCTIK